MDVAGTVEAVGQNVTQFELGDDVFGTCAGSFAEQANARVDALARKPVNLSSEQAAAVPTSAVAALQALRNAGDIQPSDQVLIIGASGGVGLFAVQMRSAICTKETLAERSSSPSKQTQAQETDHAYAAASNRAKSTQPQ